MSHQIASNEFGKVRVFQLSFTIETDIGIQADYARLEQALGAKIVTLNDVQIVSDDALHELGLAQFLMMGHGIANDDIAPHSQILNGLTGPFAIIRSGAFGPESITLRADGEAKLVATFAEERAAPPPLTPLTSDSTDGAMPPAQPTSKPPKSDARIGGMVATVALILMGLLVWLMIWIGG